jgi:hypothetical protein
VSFAKVKARLGFGLTRTVPDGIAEVARLVRDEVVTGFDAAEYRN